MKNHNVTSNDGLIQFSVVTSYIKCFVTNKIVTIIITKSHEIIKKIKLFLCEMILFERKA